MSLRCRTSMLIRRAAIVLVCVLMASPASADDAATPPAFKHQITGLFCAERVADLEKAAATLPGIELESIDFAAAEAVFRYDPAKAFPNAKPEQIVERFDNLLKQASRHTFGAKPLCATPREKLKRIEIAVVGLDCKACSLAAYEAVYKLEGVEQATASFKLGMVTAWVHSDKTDRETLETALLQRNVMLKDRGAK